MKGNLHEPTCPELSQTWLVLEIWSVWGSCVHFNGNSMTFITHLLPTIWIFTAQQAWWAYYTLAWEKLGSNGGYG